MPRMFDPPHPGLTLRDDVLPALGLSVTEAAEQLGVSRVALSRVLNGRAAISPEMALRVEAWLGVERGGDARVWLAVTSKAPLQLSSANILKNHRNHRTESRRKWLAAGAALPALTWLGALHAQANAPVVIGSLIPGSRGEGRGTLAFHEAMAALGWKLGTHYVVEARFADGRADRLPALAQELATKKPAVIVVFTSVAARAAAAAAPATPIVLASGDPLSTGLVTNLARPGGMITGLSNVSADLNLKLIELLVEAMPTLKRVGFLNDSTSTRHATVAAGLRSAAERLRIEAVIVDVAKPEDLEPAMARLAKEKVQALVLLASVWVGQFHPKIIGLALAQRWPVVGIGSGTPRQGGLFSYGPDNIAMVRRSAFYVDRILKGTKPGDLPIEQPTAFDLVLNMKTAKALGITMPPSMRVRATEVIE